MTDHLYELLVTMAIGAQVVIALALATLVLQLIFGWRSQTPSEVFPEGTSQDVIEFDFNLGAGR
jgi:hypothetical protein